MSQNGTGDPYVNVYKEMENGGSYETNAAGNAVDRVMRWIMVSYISTRQMELI